MTSSSTVTVQFRTERQANQFQHAKLAQRDIFHVEGKAVSGDRCYWESVSRLLSRTLDTEDRVQPFLLIQRTLDFDGRSSPTLLKQIQVQLEVE